MMIFINWLCQFSKNGWRRISFCVKLKFHLFVFLLMSPSWGERERQRGKGITGLVCFHLMFKTTCIHFEIAFIETQCFPFYFSFMKKVLRSFSAIRQ